MDTPPLPANMQSLMDQLQSAAANSPILGSGFGLTDFGDPPPPPPPPPPDFGPLG